MSFDEFLLHLGNGKTVEQITNRTMVECCGNEVYEDNDLYEFMCSMGAEIEDFGVEFVLISTNDEKYYEVPYEIRDNRFDKDCGNETVIIFDYNRIYDVTDNYY